ncbi:metal ABC transporter solute-binding protein, Zn/Mn family [Pseudomonas cremoricolorata]|uniref:metal ABC transporter solute-binding protein, Zn/Mn family n=1 Tax=Pseudomonas cremoricolorata TaxID=157783 RepID=UPI000406AA83|nr:zinc ABC transporter substrate-binding protein [Pseudomonas cremoricolorata]
MSRTRRPSQTLFTLLLAVLLSTPLAAMAEGKRQQVLVALPALHALTAQLSEGTQIEVVRVPQQQAVPMESLASALPRLDPAPLQRADAVVTLSRLWPADPLYAAARRQQLRTVEIDASRSWDAHKPAVAVVRVPANDVPWAAPSTAEQPLSPFVWLGPVNAMRMAALIAADLARLSPPDAPRITVNLSQLESSLRQLKAEYGARMLALNDVRVLSLATEFSYLFDEFGVYVEGVFARQDLDWSAADRAALSAYLRERDIRVVVHKWPPADDIAAAISAGGARLVILDSGNPGLLADPSVRYDALLRSNLEALLKAFDAKPEPATAPGAVATTTLETHTR